VQELVAPHESVDIPDANLTFNEFIFMMQSDSLASIVGSEWRSLSRQMRAFRHAFDTTDVDGNHELEFAELQMAMLAIDPHSQLSDQDVVTLWSVLAAPARAEQQRIEKQLAQQENKLTGQTTRDLSQNDWKMATQQKLDFQQFLLGMAAAQRDKRTSEWVDVLKPNRWELLSLLVDTPVSRCGR
jgi:hypothetical protein